MNRLLAFIVLLTLSLSTAQGSNWQWLRNTGLQSLSDTDWEILSNTLNSALDSAANGETRHWKNPETKNQGSIEILDSPSPQDGQCRRVQITTEVDKKRIGESLTFCRDAEGRWPITPPNPAKDEAQ